MTKMKPEDVMRALECCSNLNCDCCPFKKPHPTCMSGLPKAALALLREKDAEIERLREMMRLNESAYQSLSNLYDDDVYDLMKRAETARSEAITEFAKELTSELIKCGIYPVFVKGAIERTEKKLKGATNGKTDD